MTPCPGSARAGAFKSVLIGAPEPKREPQPFWVSIHQLASRKKSYLSLELRLRRLRLHAAENGNTFPAKNVSNLRLF